MKNTSELHKSQVHLNFYTEVFKLQQKLSTVTFQFSLRHYNFNVLSKMLSSRQILIYLWRKNHNRSKIHVIQDCRQTARPASTAHRPREEHFFSPEWRFHWQHIQGEHPYEQSKHGLFIYPLLHDLHTPLLQCNPCRSIWTAQLSVQLFSSRSEHLGSYDH